MIIFNFIERLYEAELENFLRFVLKNGIQDLGIPPLDRFVYEGNISIGETDMPGMMT
jgi:hypothetical protein